MFQSSIGQVSRVESTGGSWKLKMQWVGSATWAIISPIINPNSSSEISRGVFQGVGVEKPMLIIV